MCGKAIEEGEISKVLIIQVRGPELGFPMDS